MQEQNNSIFQDLKWAICNPGILAPKNDDIVTDQWCRQQFSDLKSQLLKNSLSTILPVIGLSLVLGGCETTFSNNTSNTTDGPYLSRQDAVFDHQWEEFFSCQFFL